MTNPATARPGRRQRIKVAVAFLSTGMAVLFALSLITSDRFEKRMIGDLSDGPLVGADGAGEIFREGPNGSSLGPGIGPVTFGCQLLHNAGAAPIAVTDIQLLIQDRSFRIDEGPLLATPGPSGVTCSEWGLPSEVLQDKLSPLPVNGWILDPGEYVNVYYGLSYDGSPRAVIYGHIVEYLSDNNTYRELYEWQLLFCDGEDFQCEPEPPLRSRTRD